VPKRGQAGHSTPGATTRAAWWRPVQALVGVRLPPDASRQILEKQLRSIPAVRSAWHVTGEVDYELQVSCPDLGALRGVLRDLSHCCGAEVAAVDLVLAEVPGLAGQP
jgi:AsnC-like helix-turn-helix protein